MMASIHLDNDTRGWVMAVVSGIACVAGASIIYIDSLVQLFPGKKEFRIQDSNAFLACSLSLSFGVMIFMALYSMLPEAESYLKQGDVAKHSVGFVLIGCFVGGFVGIQVVSRLFHRFLPSHVVDCDHSHLGRPSSAHHQHHGDHQLHSHRQSWRNRSLGRSQRSSVRRVSVARDRTRENGPTRISVSESTPLLTRAPTAHEDINSDQVHPLQHSNTGISDTTTIQVPRTRRSRAATENRRPSLIQLPKRVLSFMKDTKENCDQGGPCYGYSDPCGQECFKHLSSRSALGSRATTFIRTTTNQSSALGPLDRLDEDADSTCCTDDMSPTRRSSQHQGQDSCNEHHNDGGDNDNDDDDDYDSDDDSDDEHDSHHNHDYEHHDHQHGQCGIEEQPTIRGESTNSLDLESQHHHHVAENAFLSIGLQTSIAIALHKLPEGFITYTTNHASPSLGFNVFLALFVHNISEGFAMALPLYMAVGSRLSAMAWSSVLGGLSQPLGAAIAMLWLKVLNHTNTGFSPVTYGCLFAATAGIMASVALQLFVESLSLNHDRNLSILFAFLGMALLGLSNAFTAHTH